MTRSQSLKMREWFVQVVHVDNPDITSLAALTLLNQKYYSLDKSIYTDFRMSKIRKKWMKKQMEIPDEMGGLTCAICGRKGLLPNTKNKMDKATLDHIIEISLGGDWRDPSNFQVACYKCNILKNKRLQEK